MASSAAVVSPPPPKPLDSDVDEVECDEESEYEEVEEEMEVDEDEVEFEEEIEEEVDYEYVEDKDEDIGEDLTPVREGDQVNDTNENMEPEEQKEQNQSAFVAQGAHVSNPLADITTVQRKVDDFGTSKSTEKEELHIHGERTSIVKDLKASSFNDSGEVNNVKTAPLFPVVNTALLPTDSSKEKDSAVASVTADRSRTAAENVDIRQTSPRLHVPQVRLRGPTSSAESDRENKKLRIVCEFHAKGWCIKGKSCRFLHIRDGLDAAGNKSEILEREASSSGPIPKLNIETKKFAPHKDDTFESTPIQAGEGIFGPKLLLDKYSHYASPLVKGSLIERNRTYHGKFSGSTSHDSKRSTGISPLGATLEGTISKDDIVHSDPSPADLPFSHPRQPLSFGSSSWSTDARGKANLLEHRASLSSSFQLSGFPVSASETANLSLNHIFRDTELRKCNTRISFDDWEPSVPFLPSHTITRSLLMEQRLYDPLREGIEKTKAKDAPKPMKFSFSDQESSIKNLNVQTKSSEEEEKLLNSSHVGDTVKDNFLSSSNDNILKIGKPMEKTEVKDEGSGKHDETPVDFKGDGHIQSESKAFKYFQGALIEFVKELVKPTWREGLLSKNAHNLIVKKAVDRVLSTLQPPQIPNTSESVKLYLSASQAKLAKLVEAYIDKYGKF